MEKFVQLDKTKLNHIPISEFADFIHQDYEGSKTEYLVKHIEKWILDNYDKTIHANDLMPTKNLCQICLISAQVRFKTFTEHLRTKDFYIQNNALAL